MDKESRQYVIGTAGHIDHGKTALIQALTGINTDRLKEEQERGITIDLGFAHFSDNVTIIDVPGHERLIKNMVAGVSTIDLVLFVIAADDGIMPQTREHLDIVKLLGISHGIFVITKIDLVDEEWLLMVEEEIGNLLKGSVFENAPVLKTSAVTGEGIEDVRKTIFESLKQIERREDDGIFRLPIDRVFGKPGFGTVVTGSVLSGQIDAGGAVEILPELIPARVRGLQSHDRPVESVSMGDRAALNLTGIGNDQLHRGQVIAQAGYYRAVQSFNARLTPLPDETVLIKNRMRVRIHLHTAEIFARLVLPELKALDPGQSAMVQFRLEKPVYASFGDHFIIRQYSPQITLGGGIVLETNPPKYRKRHHDLFVQRLENLESDDPERRIPAAKK
ncbi:MAG: selenocysteine-specific translation elongation factor [Calditrichia bacterium]